MILSLSTMAHPSHGRSLSSSSHSRSIHSHSGSSSPVPWSSPGLGQQRPLPAANANSASYSFEHAPSHSSAAPSYLPPPLSTHSSTTSLRHLATTSGKPEGASRRRLEYCDTCLTENIRCDRQRPCTHCRELALDCVYSHKTRRIHRAQHMMHRAARSTVTTGTNSSPTFTNSDVEDQGHTDLVASPVQDDIDHWIGINQDIRSSLSAGDHGLGMVTMEGYTEDATLNSVASMMREASVRSNGQHHMRWRDVAVTEPTNQLEPASQMAITQPTPAAISFQSFTYQAAHLWDNLLQVCGPQDTCNHRIQSLLEHILDLSYLMFVPDHNVEDVYIRNSHVKSQFLEDVKVISMCACSNQAGTAGGIIMACLAILRVFEINIMCLDGRLHETTHLAPTFESDQPRALTFKTVILPELPDVPATPAYKRSLASYSAANQHIQHGPENPWQSSDNPYAELYAYQPTQPARHGASEYQSEQHQEPGSQYSNMTLPNIALPPLSMDKSHSSALSKIWADLPRPFVRESIVLSQPSPIVGDLRLMAEIPRCQEVIKEIISRYRDAHLVQFSQDRTGYDLEDEKVALTGMSWKLKERLDKVLKDMSEMGKNTKFGPPTYPVG